MSGQLNGGASPGLKPAVRLPRRRGAGRTLQPATTMPPGTNSRIADRRKAETRKAPVRDGDGGTGAGLRPERKASPVATRIADRLEDAAHDRHVRDGDGGTSAAVQPRGPLSPVAATIAALVQLQRQRTFCIRSQSRTDRSTEAFIARECLGYHTGLPEPERRALMAQAIRIRLAGERPLRQGAKGRRVPFEAHTNGASGNGRDRRHAESQHRDVPPVDPPDLDADDAGGDRAASETQLNAVPGDGPDHSKRETHPEAVPAVAAPIITMSFFARTAADSLRRATERGMERLAATLPVAPWQARIRGFGRLGLAVIVAEAGRDLMAYPTVSTLWKRLGLAVIDGERQRRKTDPVLALLHGYAPRRRAEMWALSDSMLRHQVAAARDGDEGGPTGPYGHVYARRRARTAVTHPEWSRAHMRDDARRVMFKALIADLWGAWRISTRPEDHPCRR